LEKLLSDDSMQAYLAAMGINMVDAWETFKLIDTEGHLAIEQSWYESALYRPSCQAPLHHTT